MKKLLVLALAASMTLGLAACGSSSSDKAAETAPAETTEGTDAAESTGSDKTWVIAMDTVFRPFEYTDENGEFVGIDVDIIKAVAANQGFNIEIQSLGWDAAVTAVQAGQADALLAGASITDERKANGWIFSDSYYDSYQVFAAKTDSGIESLDDLKGKTIAVKNATAGANYAESLKDEYGFKIDTYEDSPTMYQAVVLGQADACVEDKPIMADNIKTGGLDLTIVESTASEVAPYGFAIMNKDNQELLDMFNKGLQEIKDNGTYDEILNKYLGE
ncbi:transporter substrate-binding domain-containing protein [Candidatus Merdisoma sp. HCP28S3_D10]|uniref:transporter substrate-binding domain-containing protein n=1 Tax=unclassified Candidatus Merdisoma TaxID=3099611 RepID=UPI003F88E950